MNIILSFEFGTSTLLLLEDINNDVLALDGIGVVVSKSMLTKEYERASSTLLFNTDTHPTPSQLMQMKDLVLDSQLIRTRIGKYREELTLINNRKWSGKIRKIPPAYKTKSGYSFCVK